MVMPGAAATVLPRRVPLFAFAKQNVHVGIRASIQAPRLTSPPPTEPT